MSEAVVIKVGMADLKIGAAPDVLTTLGLGSCVGIALYDSSTKIGGLAHIMLPDSTQIKNNENVAKFADTGVKRLVDEMINKGAKMTRLVAKIAGGAHMFEFKQMDETMKIGARNVVAVTQILQELRIPIIAKDTGANYGRTIELDMNTGILMIRTIGHGIKEI